MQLERTHVFAAKIKLHHLTNDASSICQHQLKLLVLQVLNTFFIHVIKIGVHNFEKSSRTVRTSL